MKTFILMALLLICGCGQAKSEDEFRYKGNPGSMKCFQAGQLILEVEILLFRGDKYLAHNGQQIFVPANTCIYMIDYNRVVTTEAWQKDK